jgi:lactoylglutathione lyase
MDKSVSFYKDVIGLPLRFQSPGWTEFSTDGATIALHASDVPTLEKEVSPHSPAGSCRPGLAVPDLDEFHRRVISVGVVCVQEPKSIFGAKVAQYVDPDGLVISVGEERRNN